jgi:hypothetical protein
MIHLQEAKTSHVKHHNPVVFIIKSDELNSFHICACKGYFNSRNKTNEFKYVKYAYHMLFTTNMSRPLSRLSSVQLPRVLEIQTNCQM